jgi:predicted heme/steroid binding protein
MKRISREELARSDGQEGRPAHVAVEGAVYDVTDSKRWSGGKHMNAHLAGADLTQALQAAPHGAEVLQRMPAVGELEDEQEVTAAAGPTGLLAWVLAQHPHPMSVHFPIALLVTAALFTVVGLVLGEDGWREAALLNLSFGTLALFPAIGAGLLSHRYNYAGTWTPIFRFKLLGSVLLVLLSTGALCIRFLLVEPDAAGGGWYWLFSGIVVGQVPVVASIGYMGGRITFPR